jgi:hypothetical protein
MKLIDLSYLVTILGAAIVLIVGIMSYVRNNQAPFVSSVPELLENLEKLPVHEKIFMIAGVLMLACGFILSLLL